MWLVLLLATDIKRCWENKAFEVSQGPFWNTPKLFPRQDSYL